MSAMIEVTGLRVVLPPAVVAVDGIDLTVQPGEFVVILGRSGSGKTTFLRAINRLVEPTAGTVQVAGSPVTGADRVALRAARRQIGMVFQQFNLVRRASVLDNVLAGRLGYVPPLPSLLGRFPEADRALAHACLEQVGLAHLADRRADTLSGGEQQRVAIARALAQAPAVILADEPTASLDPALTAEIMGILRSINTRAAAHAGRQPAPARDGAGLRQPHRRLPRRPGDLRRPAGRGDASGRRGDLRGEPMKRAALFAGLVVLAWTAWDTGADPVRLVRGIPWILDFLRRSVPPDPSVLPAALAGALKTVEIALLGTAVAAALALPLGFLSARNVAPAPLFQPARVVLNFFRSIDTLVYALVFVAAVGLGPFPGVLAVIAYTTTSLAKLYSEAIEGIEPGPVDAVIATGATRLQVLRYGVLPQVLPLFLSYVLYRLETNIRAATVLGFVGAGGIGFYLQTYLRMIDYRAASTALLVTIAMVMIVDALSSHLRARLV